MTEEEDLCRTITEFRRVLPGWWFTVGHCKLTSDASCGPDAGNPLCRVPRFDEGFHADLEPPATLADAMRVVMGDALEAKAAVKEIAA